MIADFLDWLAALPPAGVVAVAGLLVFGECALGPWFVAPGETELFVLGTTATSPPRFAVLWLITTACATAGDAVGYALGRKYGPRLRRTPVVRRYGAASWDRASEVLRRRGAPAALVAIFLPVLRTLVMIIGSLVPHSGASGSSSACPTRRSRGDRRLGAEPDAGPAPPPHPSSGR